MTFFCIILLFYAFSFIDTESKQVDIIAAIICFIMSSDMIYLLFFEEHKKSLGIIDYIGYWYLLIMFTICFILSCKMLYDDYYKISE